MRRIFVSGERDRERVSTAITWVDLSFPADVLLVDMVEVIEAFCATYRDSISASYRSRLLPRNSRTRAMKRRSSWLVCDYVSNLGCCCSWTLVPRPCRRQNS